MFAPSVFTRRHPQDGAHIVQKQPRSQDEIEEARAALAACPVAAIRVESPAHRSHRNEAAPLTLEHQQLVPQLAINPKFNGLPRPFPRPISSNIPDIYFVGHHSEASFGAAPYLLETKQYGWIMVDTPKYSKAAVRDVESLMGQTNNSIVGPSYLVLTHVDDTADHDQWKQHYPNLKQIFHAGDLGEHNWIGDETLEDVEILLQERSVDDADTALQLFAMDGTPINDSNSNSMDDNMDNKEELVLIHTPGHSPGSISLWKRPTLDSPVGVLFTGDTYSYSTRGGGAMSGFPRYGHDLKLQSRVLPKLLDLEWQVVAPGHGHVRDYTTTTTLVGEEDVQRSIEEQRREEMQPAIQELLRW
jgi:glyoxylase-like metal-dependent hydrolase (beta-lactamase superfamily II)